MAKDEVQPRIIEWAGVLADSEGNVVDELTMLINPEQPLEPIITKITGLTDEALADQPTFAQCAARLRSFFERATNLIAHNLPFDRTMMELELKRHNITDWPWPATMTCTVQEHAEEFGRRPKLTELYEHYTGDKLDQSHRALDDVEALLTVAEHAGVLL